MLLPQDRVQGQDKSRDNRHLRQPLHQAEMSTVKSTTSFTDSSLESDNSEHQDEVEGENDKRLAGKFYSQNRFNSAQQSMLREHERHQVRKQSILQMDQYDQARLKGLSKRILENDQFTGATADFESEKASKISFISMSTIRDQKKVFQDHTDQMTAIDRRLKSQLKKIVTDTKGKPMAPKLKTQARGEKRKAEFEARMKAEYGEHWRMTSHVPLSEQIALRAINGRVKHPDIFVNVIGRQSMISLHKYIPSIHEPIDWNSRCYRTKNSSSQEQLERRSGNSSRQFTLSRNGQALSQESLGPAMSQESLRPPSVADQERSTSRLCGVSDRS